MNHPRPFKDEPQQIRRLGAHTVRLPPLLEDLLAAWLQKCAGRGMPSATDLPPEDLRNWAGNLAIIAVPPNEQFWIRQSGFDLIRRFGREATNAAIAELAPDIAAQLRAILKATLKASAPVAALSQVRLGYGGSIYSEIALPLAEGGRISSVLLGVSLLRES
ncbi:MAG: PAS domain-containing protein [Proteobacteria bacterium]|nr:PAS domain-containing protein [Pseudomonadota bacterium]